MAETTFKSKSGFILASVGAAVGLGNALRFPGLCARYGGGAFLLIYIVALVLLGVPLLNAEIALGRRVGGGAPKCMASLFRGGSRLGWASCVNSAFTAIVYAGLVGWIFSVAFSIFGICTDGGLTRAEAGNYFFDEVLSARSDGVISSISPLVCIGIAIAWAAIFFCLKGGAGSLSKAARFTVLIPMVLLSLMAARGLMYPNSGEALSALFLPDFSVLSSPELWITALGQVFFSLSAAVGIMPAYGAYLPERTNVFTSSIIIAAADALVSVIASIALFTTLYGCGMQSSIGQSGIITAFSVYPAAIKGLFQSPVLCGITGILFYLSLAMMAVQSATSMLEASVAPLSEKFGWKRWRLALAVCAVGGLISLIYATSAGAVIVEICDIFVNFYNVLILCILECLALGFGKMKNDLSSEINRYTKRLKMPERPFKISIKFLCPAVLAALLLPRIYGLITEGLSYPNWAQFAFGWGVTLAVIILGFIFGRERRLSRL